MSHNSIDRKLQMKIDIGSDVNAINRKTFQKLFPNITLKPADHVLENFDKTYVIPLSTFTAFLRWKNNIYRCKIEVIDNDYSPNVLSRQTIFVINILKPCFTINKAPNPYICTRINSQMLENTPGTEKTILHSKKPKTLMQKGPSIDTGSSKAYKHSKPSPADHKAV